MKASFLLLLFLVLLPPVDGIAQNKTQKARIKKHSCCSPQQEERKQHYSDKSLYQVESWWQTQNNEKIQLGSFAGQVVVVTMIFSNCQYACPQIIADVQEIASTLPDSVAKDVRFVFITMDVRRDTPEILAEFAQKMNIKRTNWYFLHGNDGDTREIAALLGIKYKRMSDGNFSHSNNIIVLNKQGEIIHQQIGLNAESAPSVQAICTAASKP